MKGRDRPLFATALACLFCSGAAGLIYEIVWARYLALFLGHTSYAVVAVLAAFMAGLAIGNAWLGAIADRVAKPLLFYAWLELGIVGYALIFPAYYDLCHRIFIYLARAGHLHGVGLLALKFVFGFATILFPTILMGGTLPALTRFVTRSLGELQQRVGALYFINSAGAVAGCVIADFWSIPRFGLEATVLVAALLNFVVGITSLVVSYALEESHLSQMASPIPEKLSDSLVFSALDIKVVIAAIGLSGFVAMLYEVVWFRILALALGSSTHAFSLMLITFIAGIASGAWLINRWKISDRPLPAFAWAEILLAVTVTISMFYYDLLPYWFAKLASLLSRRQEAYPLYELLQALICFAVMFIPATCLGTTLPLASRIATRELAHAGQSVGKVFAINTLGTVLGASITGLFLLPFFGLAKTFSIGIVMNVLIGFAVLRRARASRPADSPGAVRWPEPLWPWVVAGLVGFFFLTGWLFDQTWRNAFTSGLWRYRTLPPTQAAYRNALRAQNNIKYYRDGAGSTVSVHAWAQGKTQDLALKVNGKVDASSAGLDVSTQLLTGHLPMLLRPGSERALIIGLGSGMTCGAVACYSSARQIDAVEISPEVAQAARLFAPHNGAILDDSRFRLIVEDAKSFLKITDQQYDVIISEPSNPWMAGVAAVFSQEYYESCRARLKDDGIMAQWVQVYETSDEAFQIMLGTFSSVFPQTSLWQGALSDLIMDGTKKPMNVDLAALEKLFNEPKVKADLARIDLTRLPVLLSRELISAENAPFILPETFQRHSDYYPVLEFVAQRAFFVGGEAAQWQRFDENLSPRPSTLFGRYLQSRPLTENDFKAFGSFFLTTKMPYPRLFQSLLHRWKQINPTSTLPLQLEAQLTDHRVFSELEAMSMAAQSDLVQSSAQQDPELLQRYERLLLASYRAQRSVFNTPAGTELRSVLERLLKTDRANRRVYYLHLAELAWDRGDDPACFQYAQTAFHPDTAEHGPVSFQLDPRAPALILARMMESYWRAGQMDRAWELCRDAERNGYLKPAVTHPLLEMTYRKIIAALQPLASAGARGPNAR